MKMSKVNGWFVMVIFPIICLFMNIVFWSMGQKDTARQKQQEYELYKAVEAGRYASVHLMITSSRNPGHDDLGAFFYTGLTSHEADIDTTALLQYEDDQHTIQKISQMLVFVLATDGEKSKAEYDYSEKLPRLFVSLPWNSSLSEYDIPVTMAAKQYDRFPCLFVEGIKELDPKNIYHMTYFPDSGYVDVWAYAGKDSDTLVLFRETDPVFKTNIDTIEYVDGEIWVPFDTHKKISRACK